LTNYLRVRFDEKKIYLLGESWGSLLGVLAVQRQPDLYYAWIGSGQMVSIIETDRRNYVDLLALAKRTGNSALANKMSSYGEPPYKDIPFANAFVMGNYDALEIPYTPPQAYIQTGTNANIGPYGILASEYNLVDRVNVLRGLIDMFTVMYPQLQELDFRSDVPSLDVPVYIFAGDSELTSRSEPMLEWYNQLHAPIKHIYSFADAGHSVVFEEFQSFRKIMVETILPETYQGR
jgi:proline iminopeptidase